MHEPNDEPSGTLTQRLEGSEPSNEQYWADAFELNRTPSANALHLIRPEVERLIQTISNGSSIRWRKRMSAAEKLGALKLRGVEPEAALDALLDGVAPATTSIMRRRLKWDRMFRGALAPLLPLRYVGFAFGLAAAFAALKGSHVSLSEA